MFRYDEKATYLRSYAATDLPYCYRYRTFTVYCTVLLYCLPLSLFVLYLYVVLRQHAIGHLSPLDLWVSADPSGMPPSMRDFISTGN